MLTTTNASTIYEFSRDPPKSVANDISEDNDGHRDELDLLARRPSDSIILGGSSRRRNVSGFAKGQRNFVNAKAAVCQTSMSSSWQDGARSNKSWRRVHPIFYIPEVLLQIFETLETSRDSSSLANSCLVLKLWHTVATKILYRSPIFSADCLRTRIIPSFSSQQVLTPTVMSPEIIQTKLTQKFLKLVAGLQISKSSRATAGRATAGSNRHANGTFVKYLHLQEVNLDEIQHRDALVSLFVDCPNTLELKLSVRMPQNLLATVISSMPRLVSFSLTYPVSYFLPVDGISGGESSQLDAPLPTTKLAQLRNLLLEFRVCPEEQGMQQDQQLPEPSSISRFSEFAIKSLIVPSLREVHLSGVSSVQSVTYLAQAIPKDIEILRLTECGGLTDETLSHIGQVCRSLRVLDVWGSSNVTDTGIHTFIQEKQELPLLEAVDVTCTAVTDATVRAIAKGCPRLHTLFIEGVACKPAIIADMIQTRGQQLREIILCGCIGSSGSHIDLPPPPTTTTAQTEDVPRNATDLENILFLIGNKCPHLQQLDVMDCGDHVAEESIRAVIKGCPLLKTFAVDEAAVGTSLFQEMKTRYEVDGVHVSSFWGVNF